MLRRLGCILLLSFQAIFFNILLPGHTRGQIVMPGLKSNLPSCCTQLPSPSKDTPKDRAANCAICSFAAHVTTPPTIDLSLPPLAFLCLHHDPLPKTCTTPECLLTCHGRAPPTPLA